MSTTVAPGKEASAPDIYLPQTATITDKSDMTAVDTSTVSRWIRGRTWAIRPASSWRFPSRASARRPFPSPRRPPARACSRWSFRRLGNVTNALYRLQVGDKVGIRGPYGTTFPVEGALKGKDILFVGAVAAWCPCVPPSST